MSKQEVTYSDDRPGSSQEMKRTTATTRIAGNVICAVLFLAYGIVLLLTFVTPGLFAFLTLDGDSKVTLWLTGLFILGGVVFLLQGITRRNLLTFWCAWPFLTCAFLEIIYDYTSLTAARLYPTYILIPAIASAATWLFSRNKAGHLQTVILFTALAAVFYIKSFTAFPWGAVIAIAVIAVAAMILVQTITSRRGRWDDGDREQRKKPIDSGRRE